MSNKLTILTNVYNEEWLLPFWIQHHLPLCDHCVVVDYGSTDSSLSIIKEMAPSWEIRKTRNNFFDAEQIDQEFMDIEKSLPNDRFVIVLNTTEFLVGNIRELVNSVEEGHNVCYKLTCYIALNPETTDPDNYTDFMNGIQLVIGPPNDRHHRHLHNYASGEYGIGRHVTRLPTTEVQRAAVLWTGFYPFNERQLARKLQIKAKMSERDKVLGHGFQHLWDKEKVEDENKKLLAIAKPLPQNILDMMLTTK